MNLQNARVIGFFSLPSPSLGEQNPVAYARAMAEAPAGAGCCAHCGRGILHHVVIRTEDGKTALIGTDCAEKVGEEIKRAVRARKTAEELEAAAAKREAAAAAWAAEAAIARETTLARFEAFRYVLGGLIGEEKLAAWRADFLAGGSDSNGRFCADLFCSAVRTGDFHSSLAAQLLARGELSPRQAECAVKSIIGRRTKKNAESWDALFSTLSPIS